MGERGRDRNRGSVGRKKRREREKRVNGDREREGGEETQIEREEGGRKGEIGRMRQGIEREDIRVYTAVVTSYIHFCEDLCIPKRKLKSFANDKPWFTGSLKAKEDAHKSGDRALYKKAKYEVQKAIRGAKIEYRRKKEVIKQTKHRGRYHERGKLQ